MEEPSASPEATLRRMERNAVASCLVMTAAALVVAGPGGAGGVIAGGALVGLNYVALKRIAGAILGRASRAEPVPVPAAGSATEPADGSAIELPGASAAGPQAGGEADGELVVEGEAGRAPERKRLGRRHRAAAVAAFSFRYALLAVGAYVMLTHLHLHPLGMIAGASSPVAAAAIEALRMLPAASRPGRQFREGLTAGAPPERGPKTGGAEPDRPR